MTEGTASIFWTGGFDSTYRVIDLLLSGFCVEPIYISARIDARNSHNYELRQMAKIRELIIEHYPALATKLLPTVDIPAVAIPNQFRTMVKDIGFGGLFRANKKAVRAGFAHRVGQPLPIGRQFAYLAIVAQMYPNPIEIGVECDGRSARLFAGKTIDEGHNRRINPELFATVEWRKLSIFSELRFPLLHTSKKEMITVSGRRNFRDILDETWTCWRPVAESGEQCGVCPACRERFTRHQETE